MKALLSTTLLFATTLAFADPVLVPAGRLVLLDGRVLKNAVIRSYDPAASKVLVVSSGKALLIPVDLLPPHFAEKAKSQLQPPADLVQTTPIPDPTAPTSASTPATSVESTPPATPASPTPKPVPAPVAPAPAAEPADPRKAHREAARAAVLRYYKYENRVGSNAVTVTDADIEFESTEPITGWTGRYRTIGKVFFAAYESVGGGSFRRGSQKFEVTTEEKSGGDIVMLDLTRK